MTKHFRAVLVCFLFLLIPVGLLAQSTNAAITGQISDPSKAVLAQAKVTVINNDTGVQYAARTNQSGTYVIPSLPPGEYRIQVEKTGFRTIIKPDVVLHLQDRVELNFEMAVGSAMETVTVSAGAPLVNTTDASVSTVVDQTYVANMPLNGRSFQDLILLTPGVATQTPQMNGNTNGNAGRGASGEFTVNGQRTESNYYTVDGVSANLGLNPNITQGAGPSGSISTSTALGTTQALVSVDDLAEFRVQTSTYSAEYGRNPGAQIAFETKSGTNQWHGAAYDYIRNNYFDANDWFSNYHSLKQAPLRQNDFGGALGGPVRIPGLYNGEDRTFFFVSYEGLRLEQPQSPSINYVPDACVRGTGPCPQGSSPAASALQQIIKAFPAPNGPEAVEQCFNPGTPPCGANGFGPSGLAEYLASWSNPSSIDSTSVRLDQIVTGKLRLFFRFSGTPSNIDFREGNANNAGFSPSQIRSSPQTARTYTAGASALLSNRLSNDLRFNYSSNYVADSNRFDNFGGGTPSDFVKALGLGKTGQFYFQIFSDDFAYASGIWQGPDSATQRQWNVVDTVSFSAGHHQFKFGGDYRRLTPLSLPANPFVGYFYVGQSDVQTNTFNNPFSFSATETFAPGYPLYQNFSAFAEDEWKVLPRLNISIGLRWEVNPAPGVTQGKQAYTVEGSSPGTWKLAPQGTPLWHTAWYNFAPRLGAAYTLRDAPGWETVVRGGGGVFFDTAQQLGSEGFGGPGFSAFDFVFGFANPGYPGYPVIPPAGSFADPTMPPYSGAPVVFPPHLQLPYTLQWNASVEQSVGKSQALTLSYVGSHASRLMQFQTIPAPANPNPGEWATYQAWEVIGNGLTSDYGALQAQFTRRLTAGLTLLASYTWSHCLDYGSMNFTSGFERGNCAYDLRHNFSGAFSYDLPNVGHNGVLNAVLHHWGVDDRLTARTGFPVDLTGAEFFDPVTGRRESNGLKFTGAPIYVYGAQCNATFAAPPFNSTLPCPGGRAINPNAFEPVASGFGDVPRNFARGFGAWQMDLAVRREFPIFERLKLQFRAEAFNVFNHPNLGSISGGCGGTAGTPGCTSPQFGQATATLANSLGILSPLYQMGGPRSMQFALKVVF